MTEKAVRAIFNKYYFGDASRHDNLNEALMASMEELFIAVLAEETKPGEILPNIIRTMAAGRSRIGLFAAMFAKGVPGNPMVPMSYILHYDHIRKAMLDAVNYTRDNYDAMQAEFKVWFTKEALKMMSGDISEALERPKTLPANVRGVSFDELNLEEEFFVKALIGILGVERCKKCFDEYNRCLKVLRQCQAECKILETMPPANES